MLLAAAISIDEFIITLFTAGRDTTLPLLIWGRIQRSVDPGLNALATMLSWPPRPGPAGGRRTAVRL